MTANPFSSRHFSVFCAVIFLKACFSHLDSIDVIPLFSLKYQPKHTHKLCPPPPESSNPSVDNQEHEKDLKHCSANDDMKTAPLKRCCTKNKGALRAITTDYTTADRMLNSKSVWSRKTWCQETALILFHSRAETNATRWTEPRMQGS